jgi:predicted enzyme related to lactoylglutathione lyase
MIKEIAFTAYPSANVQSTREWYERVLGLTFSAPYAEDGVEQYNEAHVGNGWFSLMNHEWMERDAGTGAGVSFEVDNIEAAADNVRAHGVAVADIYETPVCKLASFSDPEGNRVTLHQITVPH